MESCFVLVIAEVQDQKDESQIHLAQIIRMARTHKRKVTLAFIKDRNARRSTYRKRKSGLLKKISEITTLCGVEACAIISSPFDAKPEIWPNSDKALQVIERYRMVPEMEKDKRTFDQEQFLGQRVAKLTKKLDKQLRDSYENELFEVMNRCLAGAPFQNLYRSELNDLVWTIDRRIKEIKGALESRNLNVGTSSNMMTLSRISPASSSGMQGSSSNMMSMVRTSLPQELQYASPSAMMMCGLSQPPSPMMENTSSYMMSMVLAASLPQELPFASPSAEMMSELSQPQPPIRQGTSSFNHSMVPTSVPQELPYVSPPLMMVSELSSPLSALMEGTSSFMMPTVPTIMPQELSSPPAMMMPELSSPLTPMMEDTPTFMMPMVPTTMPQELPAGFSSLSTNFVPMQPTDLAPAAPSVPADALQPPLAPPSQVDAGEDLSLQGSGFVPDNMAMDPLQQMDTGMMDRNPANNEWEGFADDDNEEGSLARLFTDDEYDFSLDGLLS
ncbi:Agamous-like MADS-box protein AGL80-like protein [Drosera capensis]